MSNLSTLPKGDSAWLLRKAIERIIDQVSVLETNIGVSTSGNSADTQIIFNDAGTLRGDAGLVYNKTTDALTIAGLVTAGSASITGDLTVDTSTLKVDSTNNRVGIGTASPATILDIQSAGSVFARIYNTTSTADAYLLVKNGTGEGFFGINATGPYIYTAGSLPITFTTATSERYRIASDGVATWSNVGGVAGTAMTLNATGLGIGATPAERLTIGSTTAANYIKLTNLGAATGLLIGSFNTAVDIKNREVGAINLFTSDTQRMVISATGDVTISTGNVVMGTSGKGIDFSATASGSGTMTSELLNDYEEGTWTPAYSPTTGAFTTLPTVGSGKYRKIGDTVFFSIAIRTAGTVVLGAASGDIQITGFPFTCSAAGGNGTSSLFQQFNLAVSSAHLGISITGSTTIATITKNLSNGSVTYVQANELSTATGNFENLIYAFGMYNV